MQSFEPKNELATLAKNTKTNSRKTKAAISKTTHELHEKTRTRTLETQPAWKSRSVRITLVDKKRWTQLK